ncbi:splicing factor ATP-dependent RNA helicase [Seminavis robusta]|uniref:Splicing factor ATP-dependent RNA helicase n=1 Tax=Seminavis robusta TaxID=568900 RepID=A0A9N8DLX5_9STRA|nr:splicing factor ATP-dependent RNA helicase [Seminavis robusta]|eukprot:Sro152_g069390.1 splicing factor ATP-dependent RNA helicase (2462) ;mRNA; f:22546-30353
MKLSAEDGVLIPTWLWEAAMADMALQRKIRKEAKEKKNKKKKMQPSGVLLYHFTFNLRDRSFVDYKVETSSNLFFEYASATGEDVSNDYIAVLMKDDDTDEMGEGGVKARSYDVDPLREAILRQGIQVEQDHDGPGDTSTSRVLYHIIGCSNSQVQKHCYVFRRSVNKQENETRLLQILPGLLELEKEKGIPKRVKYAGLLFSGIKPVKLPDEVVAEEIQSYTNHNGTDFTDGPGLISLKLALWIQSQLGCKGDCPSVFQIRYCGTIQLLNESEEGFVCKGVLLVDPTNKETYSIQVRKSMMKIGASPKACEVLQGTLGICDYSRPTPGRLGQQQVCLLSGTVPRSDLLKLQRDHLDCMEKAIHDPFCMSWVMALDRKSHVWGAFHKLLIAELERSREWDGRQIPKVYSKCADLLPVPEASAKIKKVQLPLAASRTLFGAVFPELLHDLLNENECVVLLEDGLLYGKDSSGGEQYVIVSRSPSYHPGDIRVLRVVPLPDGHPALLLRNCLLFSTKGDRPDPDKMGGGDLDGDKYLVLWDPTLLKHVPALKAIEATKYDDNPPPVSSSSMSDDDWIHYAAMTDNAMLGEVESTFYKLAKKSGVKSAEIEQLNSLFSSLVDRHPTSMDAFRKLKGSVSGEMGLANSCVWEEMASMQAKCSEVQRISLDTDRLQSYRMFHEAAGRHSGRQSIRDKMSGKFNHHFRACMQRAEVEKTLSEVETLVTSTGASLSDSDESIYFDENTETKLAGRREINKQESDVLSKFVRRAHELFEKPIAEVIAETKPHEKVVDEQIKRKDEIIKQYEEEMSLLRCEDQKLREAEDRVTFRHDAWLKDRRRHWDSIHAREVEASATHLAGLGEQLDALSGKLAAEHRALSDVQRELDGMWFKVEWFSTTKQQAAGRKAEIQSRIDEITHMREQLGSLLSSKRHERDAQIEAYRARAQKEQDEAEATLRRSLALLNKHKVSLETKMESSEGHFADLLNGAEKKRIQVLAAEKESEANHLRQSFEEDTNQTTDHGFLQGLQDKIEVLLNGAKDIQEAISRMFCPDTLSGAEYLIQSHREKVECMELGRSHILREVAKARRVWEAELFGSDLCSSTTARKSRWQKLIASLERVFALEENRLQGFPRGGERSGPMPVYFKRGELQRHLRQSQALIVTAGTGCGKSTQVPQYIADDFYSYRGTGTETGDDPPVRICCTQPRRVAAQKLASRVAQEYMTNLGELGLVGFQVGSRGRSREECVKTSEQTVIEFVTEGKLLFNLARSPDFIQRYDCVIIDEMHERNTEQDLCLSLLRDYLVKCKSTHPFFKVVVMSASIDAQRFCKYFGDCPTMDCPGRNFPVEEIFKSPEQSTGDQMEVVDHAVNVLFEEIVPMSDEPGDVLVFLNGAADIDSAVSMITARAEKTGDLVVAYPLYSRLDGDAIAAATNPDHRCGLNGEMTAVKKKGGLAKLRKVVVCTNIAETSLTINGVRFVIESGRAKKMKFDHTLRTSVLSADWVSRASTIQRKGRAGRTNSGFCYYLYSEDFHQQMRDYDTPNILEESVDSLILFSMHVCGKSIEEMGLLDSPLPEDVDHAKQRLIEMGLLEESEDDHWCLTCDGKIAGNLSSLRPESVRMMLTAFRKYPSCAKQAMILAVLLSTSESVFDKHIEADKERDHSHVCGDHLSALKQFEWFEEASTTKKKKNLKKQAKGRGLSFRVLSTVQEDVQAVHRECKKLELFPSMPEVQGTLEECLLRSFVSGYFHSCVQCVEPHHARTVGCSHLTIQIPSPLFLDKQSTLIKTLASNEQDPVSLQDDCLDLEETRNDSPGTSDLTVVSEQVEPKFLLYGNLTKVEKIQKTFMLDASAVEGRWLQEEADGRWIKRVDFDPHPKNKCRVLIKNVGAKVLNECKKGEKSNSGDFFATIEAKCKLDALVVSYEERLVVINGDQAAVADARERIEKRVLSVLKQFRLNDRAHNPLIQVGPGMVVKGRAHANTARPEHFLGIFSAYGLNEDDYVPGGTVASICVNKKNSCLIVAPTRDFSLDTVGRALNEAKASVNMTSKKQNNNKIGSFIVNIGGAPGSNATSKRTLNLLQSHQAFSALILDGRCSGQTTSGLAFRALRQAAEQKNTFWDTFKTDVLSGDQRKGAVLSLVKSHEFFALNPGDNRSASVFKSRLVTLDGAFDFHEVEHTTHFQRYQVRRIASILSELRKRCPKVLFYIVELKRFSGEAEGNTGSLSDYLWLTSLTKVKKVRVGFSALSAKEKKQARGLLEKKLTLESLANDNSRTVAPDDGYKNKFVEACVMCRRSVRVSFGKKAGNVGTNGLEGWNLTLCGCSYCRECFVHAAVETMMDDVARSARCLCCSREVLAKDCFSIVCGGKREKGSASSQEWDMLCRLAEANYCQQNEALITRSCRPGRSSNRPRGSTTCPDCDFSMAHPSGYLFLSCRNPKCRSKICTQCYQVPTSQDDCSRCARGECEPRDA